MILTKQNVMVDIETLGVKPNAVILTIGAVKFQDKLGEQFYTTLNLDEELASFGSDKASVSAETLLWWLDQRRKYDVSLLSDPEEDDEPVRTNHQKLQSFLEFVKGADFLWSKGTNFDFPILESCLNRYGLEQNWKYYKLRDFRTIQALWCDLRGYKGHPNTHNALNDAINQARETLTIFEEMKHFESYCA